IAPDLAARQAFARMIDGSVAGHEQQVARSHGAHVVGHRGRLFREREIEFFQTRLGAHEAFLPFGKRAQSWHTARVSVKPSPSAAASSPVTPAPAATIVLLRDRPAGGIEILLIQRHRASKFAAGDHVFPGGKIEVADHPDDVSRWCDGFDDEQAARTLGATDPSRTALAHWTGAIREAFEEVGVLLAV